MEGKVQSLISKQLVHFGCCHQHLSTCFIPVLFTRFVASLSFRAASLVLLVLLGTVGSIVSLNAAVVTGDMADIRGLSMPALVSTCCQGGSFILVFINIGKCHSIASTGYLSGILVALPVAQKIVCSGQVAWPVILTHQVIVLQLLPVPASSGVSFFAI